MDPQNAAAVAANALVEEHNLLVDETNVRIDGYNALVLTSQQLVDSLRPTSA